MSEKGRRPFHVDPTTLVTGDAQINHDIYLRYRYYQKLEQMHKYFAKNNEANVNFTIPDHILPSELFLIAKPDPNRSFIATRFITIFSVWNTMVGSGLLAMPWAFSQAGYITSVFFTLFFSVLGYMTCLIILRASYQLKQQTNSSSLPDFPEVCGHYLGKRFGKDFGALVSIFLLTAAMLVYWILMSSYLYDNILNVMKTNTVPFLKENNYRNATECPKLLSCSRTNSANIKTNSSVPYTFWIQSGHIISPIALLIIFLPLISIKSPSFFARLNCLGTISIMILFIFICTTCIKCYQITRHFPIIISPSTFKSFNWSFPKLTGTLALSFLIHNAFISMLNVAPDRSLRAMSIDLGMGYVLATISYLFVGLSVYAGFTLIARGGDPSCPLQDNFLLNVPTDNKFGIALKVLLLFQMATVFPLITYLARVQCFNFLFRFISSERNLSVSDSTIVSPETKPLIESQPSTSNQRYQLTSSKYIFLLPFNVVCVIFCVVFAEFFPSIGYILRYAGGFCGFIYIFMYPLSIWYLNNKANNTLNIWIASITFLLMIFGAANFIAQFFMH